MIFRIECLPVSNWTCHIFGSLQHLPRSTACDHKKVFLLLHLRFMVIIVFVSQFHIACSWQNVSLAATNNISLVYITVNWSAGSCQNNYMLMFATWQGGIILRHKLWRVSFFFLFFSFFLQTEVFSIEWQQKSRSRDRRMEGKTEMDSV